MSEDEPYFISQAEMVVEINRLRAENETLRRDVKTAVMGDSAELADVKRENEKLNDTRIDYICKINKLVDERAKLRKALLAVYDNSLGLDPDKITDDIELVTAEIRAARKALGE